MTPDLGLSHGSNPGQGSYFLNNQISDRNQIGSFLGSSKEHIMQICSRNEGDLDLRPWLESGSILRVLKFVDCGTQKGDTRSRPLPNHVQDFHVANAVCFFFKLRPKF